MRKKPVSLRLLLLFLLLTPLTLTLSSCFVEDGEEYNIYIISNYGYFSGNYIVDGDGLNFFDGVLYEEGSTYYTYEKDIDFDSIDISVTKSEEAASIQIIIYKDGYQVAKEEIEEYECASYDSDGETCLTYTDTASLYYEDTDSDDTTE